MKTELPLNHGLPPDIVASHLVQQNGAISLTDVQFESLRAGVGRGKSLLVVAPTSSGKTNVGYFALATWLRHGQLGASKAVYLVSHRALARQKFEELVGAARTLMDVRPEAVVVATGDGAIDGRGEIASDPLAATILVATYEKFTGLLASAGLTHDMSHICFICDEVQILGDETRGADVEVLLTIVKRANFGQLVGLSAVLDEDDARAVSNWLGLGLVRTGGREVPLTYELRGPRTTVRVNTDRPADALIENLPRHRSTIEVLHELVSAGDAHVPIVVFCTRRQDVFELARRWSQLRSSSTGDDLETLVFEEQTASADDLSSYLPRRFAFHTADLVDVEREVVERRLQNDQLTVVFATTTLAFGLNFSFQTAVIHSWRRWQAARRQHEPISPAEFHNMAGRAGRLGHSSEGSRVIFFCEEFDAKQAEQYLQLERIQSMQPRIDVTRFDQLALQLLGSGIVSSDEGLLDFLTDTFSSFREESETPHYQNRLRSDVVGAIDRLKRWGFVR